MRAGIPLAAVALLVALLPAARFPSLADTTDPPAGTAQEPAGAPAGVGAGPRTEPYVEEVPDGYIDWGRGVVGAWGKALYPGALPSGEVDLGIKRAAEIVGRKVLLTIVQRMRANSELRVEDRPDFVEKVRGIVRGAEIVKDRYGRGRFFEVLIETPLNGVEGIAYGIYELMSPKPVAGGEGTSSSGPAGGSLAGAAAPGEPTGIVIDARGTGLAPALLPRIVDDSGAVVSSPETVSPGALRDRGMAAYAKAPGSVSLFRHRVGDHPLWLRASAARETDLPEIALASLSPRRPVRIASPPPTAGAPPPPDPLEPRRGPRPYHLKASSAAGTLKADVVLSKADADRLEATPGGKNLLKDCRVLVIVESPVGGVEGVRDRSAPEPSISGVPPAALRRWPLGD